MIHATDISLVRKGRTILQPLSCRFDKAGFVAVIGPNGAGKSSLLHLLSGLYTPSTGTISVLGKPLSEWTIEELAMNRAYLQQQHSVFESFSVEQVLTMGRSVYFGYKPSPNDEQMVTEMLEELQLTSRRKQAFNSLSGGEQQRVQFARTLLQLQEEGEEAMQQKILFLDEPLNNLDLHYQYSLLQMAREKVVNKGGLVIAVLHDLNSAYAFSDRVLMMHQGHLLVDAPTDEAMQADQLSAVYNIPIIRKESDGQTWFVVEQPVPPTMIIPDQTEYSYQ